VSGGVAAVSAGATVSTGALAAGVGSVSPPIPSVVDGAATSDAVGGAKVVVSGIGTADSIVVGVCGVACENVAGIARATDSGRARAALRIKRPNQGPRIP